MKFVSDFFLLTLLFGVGAAPLSAGVKLPKPPESYDVEFRYRIDAGRNERIIQFTEMMDYLKKLGFKRNETEDSDLDIFDPQAERMSGTIPSANAPGLLDEPHIQTVLLVPAGFKPADETERVKVELGIGRGFALDQQLQFSLQIKQVLAKFGFQEAVGYDHRGYTLLRGWIPWNNVVNLLADLRGLPSGWFVPLTPENEVPALLKSKLPVRMIWVLPETDAPPPIASQRPLAAPAPDHPEIGKLSADLRRLIEQTKAAGPLRIELTLDFKPNPNDNSWRALIRSASPEAVVEGLLDDILTLTVPESSHVVALARLPFVVGIRLPRTASVPVVPTAAGAPKTEEKKEELNEQTRRGELVPAQAQAELDVLKETRLDRLHARGGIGRGITVVIVDTDFAGWDRFIDKGLPKSTRFIDLTAERNRDIQPEPGPGRPGEIGRGTRCALAVRLAAPAADIALLRIAADAPHEVITTFRYTLGDYFQPESFRARREELDSDAQFVRSERNEAAAEYRKAIDEFDDEEPARERRRKARAALAAVEQKERDLAARSQRLIKLEADLIALKGVRIVLNTVGWDVGQPLDAASPLARFIDERLGVERPNPILNESKGPQPILWFQPAGDTRGQTWMAQFRDADGNGVMEFAPPGTALKPDRWTDELNFLELRTRQQGDQANLPGGARVRISIQWREPHDPAIGAAEYVTPLANLQLLLLRQRDPNGEKVASDEMEIIARSEGNPDRLLAEPEFGVYEQSIDVILPKAGRHALRVEGRVPPGIRPGGSFGLRDQNIRWELRPRIFLDLLDAPTRSKGRLVFADYQSHLGGVAVPADARSVAAIGAMRPSRRPEEFSAIGAGPVTQLYIKPNVMIYDRPALPAGAGEAKGSAISAALAAGMGACLLSAGAESADFLHYLRVPPGSIFEIPNSWTKRQ